MQENRVEFSFCDEMVKKFEEAVKNPRRSATGKYYTGVDLGTACVVMAVLDDNGEPVAGAYQYADVVRDGMVVDYVGAIRIVKSMKESIESALDNELVYAAGAIPPGTDMLDGGAVKNVIQAAGFVVTQMLDEPTAANLLLQLENGAVVDIGGGTTGISIVKNGEVVHVVDEATGGTHFTLVLAGARKMSFEEADLYKRDVKKHKEIAVTLKPVVDKISGIISRCIDGYEVDTLALVGGSSCLTGIENIVENNTGIHTIKPANPLFVTPIGIALSCTDAPMD